MWGVFIYSNGPTLSETLLQTAVASVTSVHVTCWRVTSGRCSSLTVYVKVDLAEQNLLPLCSVLCCMFACSSVCCCHVHVV